MSKLQIVLQQQIAPGVYRFPSRASLATLQAEAEAVGWRLFYLDGSSIHDKASFLAAAKSAFAMPDYVGKNWDAFEEAVNDLSWAPAVAYIVLFDNPLNFAQNEPAAFATAFDILTTAAANWTQGGTPVYVLLRKAGRSRAVRVAQLPHFGR